MKFVAFLSSHTQAPVMRCCSPNSFPAKPFPSSPSPPRVPWPDKVVDCRDSLLRLPNSCGAGAQEALPSDEIPQPTHPCLLWGLVPSPEPPLPTPAPAAGREMPEQPQEPILGWVWERFLEEKPQGDLKAAKPGEMGMEETLQTSQNPRPKWGKKSSCRVRPNALKGLGKPPFALVGAWCLCFVLTLPWSNVELF